MSDNNEVGRDIFVIRDKANDYHVVVSFIDEGVRDNWFEQMNKIRPGMYSKSRERIIEKGEPTIVTIHEFWGVMFKGAEGCGELIEERGSTNCIKELEIYTEELIFHIVSFVNRNGRRGVKFYIRSKDKAELDKKVEELTEEAKRTVVSMGVDAWSIWERSND